MDWLEKECFKGILYYKNIRTMGVIYIALGFKPLQEVMVYRSRMKTNKVAVQALADCRAQNR